MLKRISSIMVWILVLILIIFSAKGLLKTTQNASIISFTEFKKHWESQEIKSFQLKEDKITVIGSLKNDTQYETVVPSERLFQYISQHPENNSVQETYTRPSSFPVWAQYIPTILFILMMVFFWVFFIQQAQGGGGGAGGNRGVMNFGKSKAKLASADSKKVSFNDVAGADEEKAELAEIVDFLKQPKKYLEMGARIPKGVLLVGPPGTGKTLLAKAISGEAGVPFFSISGSDFVEMFVGVGASRVRDLFEQAKKNAPCIIFIDEIDAVGRQRGAGLGGGHDEREQTLNQLLVEMDGFGANEGIIMIAATNRPDILDHALLRPGRFDRQVMVGIPDSKGREAILKVHSKNKPLGEDVKLDVIAKMTPGFTGADLENLMNEAALFSVRSNKQVIEMNEIQESITRVIAGPEKKSRVVIDEDRKITAYHEAGHAIVMKLLPNCDPVHQISIIQRGMAAGYTMPLPRDERSHMLKKRLEDEIAGLLGGRVAEKLIIGDISTGASNDIERATTIAKKMVMQFGMSEDLGPICFTSGHDEVFLGRDFGKSREYSEEVAARIDSEIKRYIDEAYRKAERLLSENVNKLHNVAQALLEKEKLEGKEFEEIFNQA